MGRLPYTIRRDQIFAHTTHAESLNMLCVPLKDQEQCTVVHDLLRQLCANSARA